MSENQTPPNVNSRPEYVSGVTMDVDLGSRLAPGEVIDFDFDMFYQMAKDMGASDDEILQIHVDIIDPKYRPKNNKGNYFSPEVGQQPIAEVVFQGKKKQKTMNQVLTHEFQHYLDDYRGTLLEVTDRYTEGAEAASAKTGIVLGLGVGALTATVLSGGNLAVALPSAGLLAYGWTRAASAMKYINSSSEQRARLAAREHGRHSAISVK